MDLLKGRDEEEEEEEGGSFWLVSRQILCPRFLLYYSAFDDGWMDEQSNRQRSKQITAPVQFCAVTCQILGGGTYLPSLASCINLHT